MALSYLYFLQALPCFLIQPARLTHVTLSSNLQPKVLALSRFIFGLSDQKMGCQIPRHRTKQLTLLFNSRYLASGHRLLRGGRTNRNLGGTAGFGGTPTVLGDLQEELRLEEAHTDPEAQDGRGTALDLEGSSPTHFWPVALPLAPLLPPQAQPPQQASAPG